MKKSFIIVALSFLLLLTSCRNETLHTEGIIRKHRLSYFPHWDSEGTPFKKNISLYTNKQTDSCLIIIKNKEEDTILCHLDKSIINAVSLKYINNRNNWIVQQRDYGTTSYGDSLGEINNQNRNRFPPDVYYTINRKSKKLERIKSLNTRQFLKKITDTYPFLTNIHLAGLENNNSYVFKDTTDNAQVLYELETVNKLKYKDGDYFLEPEFKNEHKIGLYKNRIYKESYGGYYITGKKIHHGKKDWNYELRYEIIVNKYYTFRSKIERYGNLPGNDIFKTEIVAYNCKSKTSRLMKSFPKDSLFEDNDFILKSSRNGNYYIEARFSPEIYYQFDTISWKLKKIDHSELTIQKHHK